MRCSVLIDLPIRLEPRLGCCTTVEVKALEVKMGRKSSEKAA
jgi:hypothetical protein